MACLGRKKTAVQRTVMLDAYAVISRAVEEGVRYGINRAYKHTDRPSQEHLHDCIEQSVINELCEVLKFSNE